MAHPLRPALATWLPEFDFAVLGHGFAPHGRDYVLTLGVATNTIYEITFTHIVEQHYETAVAVEVWPRSWDDILTDYQRWEANGLQPQGYVWGTNWSLAYPGFDLLEEHTGARRWSDALGKPMHAVQLTTDRFKLSLVLHGARWRKTGEDASPITGVINPIAGR